MSTERQVEANRRNAERSTGPRTQNGKSRSAANALRHGLTAKQIVLFDEKPTDFNAFRTSLLHKLNPNGDLEEVLAERIVVDSWRRRRIPVLEATLYKSSHNEDPNEEDYADEIATWSLRNCGEAFANLWRHEAALDRSFSRSLHELQRLQAMRAGEQIAPPAVVDVDVNLSDDRAPNPEPILQNERRAAEPVSARGEPNATITDDKEVQLSPGLTRSQKAQLRQAGWSDDDIAKMKPEELHKVLDLL